MRMGAKRVTGLQHRRRHLLTFAVLTALLTGPSVARAGTWDLKLNRLCRIETTSGQTILCGSYNFERHKGVRQVLPDNAAFRSLMSELGVMFAPNILAPAETLGFNGFNLSVEMGFVTANPKKNANNSDPGLKHRYWRAAESVSDTAFTDETLTAEASARIDRELPSALGSTISLMARKGFWFPGPSFEFGFGVRHLIDSRMVAGVATAKLALHEGYQGLPVPALGVRGSVSRVFNTPGFNLTVAGLDFSISKAFGIAGTFNLTPYLGYQLLWIIADSGVHDATPNRDAMGLTLAAAGTDPLARMRCNESVSQDCNSSFAFLDQSDIVRHRIFIGLRGTLYVFSMLLEYSYFTEGRDIANVNIPTLGTTNIPDESGAQHAVSFSIALDY